MGEIRVRRWRGDKGERDVKGEMFERKREIGG